MTKLEQLKRAYELLKAGYEELVEDIQDPEATRAAIALRHVDKHKDLSEQANDVLTVEVPDLVIVVCDGVVQDVHAQFDRVTYVVVDPDDEPDLDAVLRTGASFSKENYESFIEDQLDSYLVDGTK